MTEVETGPFPDLGRRATATSSSTIPIAIPDLRWEREVTPTPVPNVREVRVRVFRGEEESGDDVTLTYYVRRR